MKSLRSVLNLRFESERLAARTPDIKIIAQKIASQILHGPHAAKRAGSGESFWQFREYIAGDTPSSIDWRQSAKTERIFVREKEEHKMQTHLFWVQRNADMEFHSRNDLLTKQQAASILSLTLALLFSRLSEQIGFLGQGRPGHSEQTLQKFETLLMEKTQGTLPDKNITIPRNCDLWLIGDFLCPLEHTEKFLSMIAQHTNNVTLIQVLDPAEIELSYGGRMIFETPDGSVREQVSSVRDIAAEYGQRIHTHNQSLKDFCFRLGWDMEHYRTDKDPEELLLKLWRNSISAPGRR